jgi:hypothetical protein
VTNLPQFTLTFVVVQKNVRVFFVAFKFLLLHSYKDILFVKDWLRMIVPRSKEKLWIPYLGLSSK